MNLHRYCPVGGNCSNHTECEGSCAPYVAKPHDGVEALIQKGIRDAAPLCDSIKQLQKFTDKGL